MFPGGLHGSQAPSPNQDKLVPRSNDTKFPRRQVTTEPVLNRDKRRGSMRDVRPSGAPWHLSRHWRRVCPLEATAPPRTNQCRTPLRREQTRLRTLAREAPGPVCARVCEKFLDTLNPHYEYFSRPGRGPFEFSWRCFLFMMQEPCKVTTGLVKHAMKISITCLRALSNLRTLELKRF